MQAIVFYLVYPFIYLIASLPFWALYKVSDFLFFVIWKFGYRKHVVITNLKNSFPEKSSREIETIAKSFYRFLADLTVETLKTLRMTKEEYNERCVFHFPDWLKKLELDQRSVVIVMGHYGNWEWGGPSFSISTKYKLVVPYMVLANRYFNKMVHNMRTRFGTDIIPVNSIARHMVASKSMLTATAFIADQAAWAHTAYWTRFLNQQTPVFMGPEKMAVKFGYPVVYMGVKRIKRGYYEVIPELLFEDSQATKATEISEAFTNRLERDILAEPATWLWSHKRWKHKRPE
jgi:Kdo2-lipid IVA lauroyltransferase/acyltransferase